MCACTCVCRGQLVGFSSLFPLFFKCVLQLEPSRTPDVSTYCEASVQSPDFGYGRLRLSGFKPRAMG